MFSFEEKQSAFVGAALGIATGIAISPTVPAAMGGAILGSVLGFKSIKIKETLADLGKKSKELIMPYSSQKNNDTNFSLILIINSNKLQKYIDGKTFTEKKITLSETKELINQSSFFLIKDSKAMGYDDDSDLPEPDNETDFIIRIAGQGKFNISENKTKMGLRDSITSPECTLVSMKKLISADLSEEFIRSI